MSFQLRRFAFLILANVLLAACATPEERELKKLSDASELLWAEYDNCMAQAINSSAYRRLNRNFILARQDPQSVQKMAIDRVASGQEKSDLLENRSTVSLCQNDLFEGFAKIDPGFSALLARFMSEDDELDLQIIQNEITIGQRNLITNQRFAERLKAWHSAGKKVINMYTGRLRHRCYYHCDSLQALSLMPPLVGARSDIADVSPQN